ncbi:hypothetical protein [Metabacillus fastidiosus]|uniref:hypothetical protein n=1 Tax=Metabacillus fastidiosus TaxID=1458 RepID=UPI003D268A05
MKKIIYPLSILLTIVVFIFIFIRLSRGVLWINNAPADGWVALIGLFAIPTFIYHFLKSLQVRLSKIKTSIKIAAIIHAGWLLWTIGYQLESYAYIKSNDVISSPYLIHENKYRKDPNTPASKYTLYKSVNPIVFVRESVITEAERGFVNSIRRDGGNATVISGSVYIETKLGILFVR